MADLTVVPTTKRCPAPGHEGPRVVPVSEFGKDRSKPSGLTSWCKTCNIEAQRRRYAANSERKRERNRHWRTANPELVREQNRRSYLANRERRREAKRQRYAANREHELETARQARITDPEKFADRARRYRGRVRDAVLDHYGRACACCGSTDRLTIDHINGDGEQHRIELFGVSVGGPRFYAWLRRNGFPPGFQTLCMPCNASKQTGERCRLNHEEIAS